MIIDKNGKILPYRIDKVDEGTLTTEDLLISIKEIPLISFEPEPEPNYDIAEKIIRKHEEIKKQLEYRKSGPQAETETELPRWETLEELCPLCGEKVISNGLQTECSTHSCVYVKGHE